MGHGGVDEMWPVSKGDYNHADYRPYVLWFETLPSGDEAKLFIYPQQYQANVVLHWNGTFHSVQTLASRDLAEQRGWEMHHELFSTDQFR